MSKENTFTSILLGYKPVNILIDILKEYDDKLKYQISNKIYKQLSNDLYSEFITATIKLYSSKDVGIILYDYRSDSVSENDKYYSENKELRKMIGNEVTKIISTNIDINILKNIIQRLGGGYIIYDKDRDRIIENINGQSYIDIIKTNSDSDLDYIINQLKDKIDPNAKRIINVDSLIDRFVYMYNNDTLITNFNKKELLINILNIIIYETNNQYCEVENEIDLLEPFRDVASKILDALFDKEEEKDTNENSNSKN